MTGNLKRRVEKLEQSSGAGFETKIRALARAFRADEEAVWEAVKDHEHELGRHLLDDGITLEGLELLVGLL